MFTYYNCLLFLKQCSCLFVIFFLMFFATFIVVIDTLFCCFILFLGWRLFLFIFSLRGGCFSRFLERCFRGFDCSF